MAAGGECGGGADKPQKIRCWCFAGAYAKLRAAAGREIPFMKKSRPPEKKENTMYFAYGKAELDALSAKDPKLAAVIAQVGMVQREVDTDLFSAVVHHIIGQQISTKAQATIWQRMREALGTVDAAHILAAEEAQLQALGMSFRKAQYIMDFAQKVQTGEFDPEGIREKSDEEAIRELSALQGIGVWTAEMILLFCMQRPDVLSYSDLAIQRGLRMVYHHRKITRPLFEKYRRRFSPYGSVASLYLWAVAGGAVPGMKDYAPRTKAPERKKQRRSSAGMSIALTEKME